jgi:hypothetical protein
MLRIRSALAAAFVALAAGPALAQSNGPVLVAESAPLEAGVRIPTGTVVQVELAEPLSSRTSQIGQLFALRLRQPIVIDGREIVPAGALGGGEVIDADSSGFGGRQGKLILSGRYLEIGGQRVRIRSMQLTAVGEDRATTSLVVAMIPYAGIAGIFINGGEIDLPAGAYGAARLAVDAFVSASSAEQPAVETTAVEQTSTSGENQE